MNKQIIFACAVLMGINANAQKLTEDQVPAGVIKKFKARFSSVQHAKWEKENTDYEANFILNKIKTSALFDATGNLRETESEIAQTNLPKVVSEEVGRSYSGYKIKETSKIETKGLVTYEVEVQKGEKFTDLIFDEKGKLLKTTPKEDEKD
jgi:hypothetical protein